MEGQLKSGKRPRKGTSGTAGKGAAPVRRATNPEDRLELIRRTAYFLAECRGFDPSLDLTNWLDAERQVDAKLVSKPRRSR
jgi:hypothetical protein